MFISTKASMLYTKPSVMPTEPVQMWLWQVSQAQSEPEPTAEAETVRQPLASITDRAHRLHALVLPGQVFRLWLEGLESKATANKVCRYLF